jgi:FdhD protein
MKPFDDAVLPPGVRVSDVHAWRAGQLQTHADWLAEEVPVALVFNGISHAVMLASPDHLEDFALGFSLTEGLLTDASELYGVEVLPGEQGIELRLEVASACEWRLKQRRRNLAGRTGCGLCGTESLDQLRREPPAALPEVCVAVGVVGEAIRALKAWQSVQQLTGASHAAAWCDLQGRIVLAREDIGRHNALDKLAGAMSRAQVDTRTGWICVTSRASFEMVQKASAIGAGMLAAVSAPTALAVDLARQNGLALAGFVRGNDFVAYHFPQRFGLV